MVKTESIKINNSDFKRTFSDAGFKIRKVGTDEIYDEAVDLPDKNFIYEETSELIQTVQEEENV